MTVKEREREKSPFSFCTGVSQASIPKYEAERIFWGKKATANEKRGQDSFSNAISAGLFISAHRWKLTLISE